MARMWAENFAHAESASRDSLIQYEGRSGGAHGHNYFRTNPAVASGLVLTVRYGREIPISRLRLHVYFLPKSGHCNGIPGKGKVSVATKVLPCSAVRAPVSQK